MPKYDVQIREVHCRTVRVTAGSPALAKAAAHTLMEEGLDELDVEYSHTMEEHEWDAKMVIPCDEDGTEANAYVTPEEEDK